MIPKCKHVYITRRVCTKKTFNFINVTTDLNECAKINNSTVKKFLIKAEEETIGEIDGTWHHGYRTPLFDWYPISSVCPGFPFVCSLDDRLWEN